jgi:D-beta-D-heptose 7-phosphate kinase/D-beta-D-heptose 1-phosphate adenosyltransferase
MGQYLQLNQILDSIRIFRSNKKIVFTNGCFDLLHVGHVRYLQQAKLEGDILIVGINSDDSVKRLKGPTRPLQGEDERAEIISALACVSYSTVFQEDTPLRLIEAIRPDCLVKGGDWKVDQIVGGSFVQSYGGVVKSLNFIPGRSTTNLVERIKI